LRKIVQAQDVFRALPNDLNLLCKVNLSPITFSRTILKWKSIEQSVIDYQHMPKALSFQLRIVYFERHPKPIKKQPLCRKSVVNLNDWKFWRQV